MRSFLGFGFGLLVWVSAGRASAQDVAPRAHRFELGVSSGYSVVGLGRLRYANFDSLWAVPLLVDVDYRVSKHWVVGAYGELGFFESTADDLEDAESSIDGHHFRLGLEAVYHSAPERHVQPWFGVGLGYDALRLNYHSRSTFPPLGQDSPDPDRTSPIRADGFEVGHAQLGIHFAFVPWLAFGPFISGSVVAYGRRRGFYGPNDHFNVWSTIGLKATLRL